jgi:SlyX protein
MNSEAVEKIELRIAFLERANNELSDVVYEQQREIADLRTQLADLANRMENLRAEPLQYSAEQERPPHY